MDLLLDADDIHASYDQRHILKGVTFSLNRGEILGLIGTNGAGKSTLMGVLAGAQTHHGGRITLAGEKYWPDSPEAARACGVGLIPQNFRLDPRLTVAEAIFRDTFQAGKPHTALRDQAAALIQHAGVEVDPDAKVGTLIRAHQALVEILRMIAEEAQLVIMDEVAASLPDHEVAILHRVLRMLTAQGRGIIYITHRLDEIRSIANRIAVLRNGKVHRILEAGTTDVDELAFLLLQQKLDPVERPRDNATGQEALRVTNLGVGNAVRGVSFAVSKGELFGLAGTHHSGVYQLVEALAGIRPSTSGSLHVQGQPATLRSVQDASRLKIGFLSDDDLLDEHLSITEGIQAAGHPTGTSLHDEISRLREVVDVVRRMRINTTNIHGSLDTLSGGDRQKVHLAKWMSAGCDVLILSHPSRGIDIGAREVVYRMLKELSQLGVAIILLSADLSELVGWCHRIGVMRDGGMVTIEANENTNEDVLVHHMLGRKFETEASDARRLKA